MVRRRSVERCSAVVRPHGVSINDGFRRGGELCSLKYVKRAVAFTAMSFWVTGQLKGLALLAQLGVLASREEEPIGSRPLKVSVAMVKASSGATRGYREYALAQQRLLTIKAWECQHMAAGHLGLAWDHGDRCRYH